MFLVIQFLSLILINSQVHAIYDRTVYFEISTTSCKQTENENANTKKERKKERKKELKKERKKERSKG